jgi:hypothetical protein
MEVFRAAKKASRLLEKQVPMCPEGLPFLNIFK